MNDDAQAGWDTADRLAVALVAEREAHAQTRAQLVAVLQAMQVGVELERELLNSIWLTSPKLYRAGLRRFARHLRTSDKKME